MTKTFGIMVLDSILACLPLRARKKKPKSGRMVNPKHIAKAMASPILLEPSSSKLPFKITVCPSTLVVETHLTERYPALPHPLALFLSICRRIGVPCLMSKEPALSFTSFSTMATGIVLDLLVIFVVILTESTVPLSSFFRNGIIKFCHG